MQLMPLSSVEEAIKADDLEQIEKATKELTEASSGLAEKMYAEQAAAGASDAGEGAESADDEAVDAEFEEVKEDEK
jgi:molecular chaperone DnaK